MMNKRRKGHASIRVFPVVILLILILTFTVHGSEPFELHLLDVGQGQCVLIEADGKYMLIDGGGRGTSSFVVSYLKQQGIEYIDYIALSHYDEDHMNGVIGALSAFPCMALFVPPYVSDIELYDSFAKAALSNGCLIVHPELGYTFQLGEAAVEFVGPLHTDYSLENDKSLSIHITYKDVSCLVCGDTEKQGELDMAESGENLSAQIYVVNHHGGSTSSMDAFLDAVSPDYAMISCGVNNKFGHPSMEVLQRLQNHRISMFRTDLQSTVVAYSDGNEIWFNTEPCEDWSSGKVTETRVLPVENQDIGTSSEGNTFTYICNTNTKRFHYLDCKSVAQIKSENRMDTDKNREELIEEGYKPCGNCKP